MSVPIGSLPVPWSIARQHLRHAHSCGSEYPTNVVVCEAWCGALWDGIPTHELLAASVTKQITETIVMQMMVITLMSLSYM